jgi:hypothetical protein
VRVGRPRDERRHPHAATACVLHDVRERPDGGDDVDRPLAAACAVASAADRDGGEYGEASW